MDNGKHKELTSISFYLCDGLYPVGEDVFSTRELTGICELFGHQNSSRNFYSFKDRSYQPNAECKEGQSGAECQEINVVRCLYECRVSGNKRRSLFI